ncbi:GLUG motif-containing protein, partial [Pseudomonas lopnurensis]|uniref:GLUG motif-containing protein n=1 Tax=Pseudomonas lopnurensis TaxID=1477517 RepID=UPI00187946CE
MNRAFALVWNHSLGAWTVASEHARRHGRRGTSRAAAGALALGIAALHPACALGAGLPTGGSVVSGSASIASDGTAMTIDQASHKAVIDWSSFDIGAGHSVTFVQPSSSSSALNRVTGSDASSLYGTLNANGRVFLVNPNGILFGASAQINVGALVASTLNLSNEDFAAGNYAFKGDGSNASVVNQGSITASDGGAVALLGGSVSNQGTIVAKLGTVALAAGNAVTLDFAGDGLLNVQVDEAVIDALVENRQLIQADGGGVILTAQASDALLQTVVNNSGVIEARTLGEREGRIVLLGGFDGGTVQVAGTLDASAADGGDGGFVETSGAHVQVANTAVVTTKATQGTTGTWLIDPTDFTVSAGNASQSDSGIGADTLSANLQNTSVTLATVASGSEDGDINVNAVVGWDASTTLTLNAHGDININAAITATGDSAGLVLNHGGYAQNGSASAGSDYHVNSPVTLSGGNASLSINGNAYSLIHSMAELASISGTGRYALAQSLDASGTTYGSALVGTLGGTFAGLGNNISNLSIDTSESYAGLFRTTNSGGTIRDLGLVDAEVSGGSYVGALVGDNTGTISNVYAQGGSVSGSQYVGGLVGFNAGSISNVYATGSVSGGNSVGGLVGYSVGGSISNAYATGSVTYDSSRTGNGNSIGGLVGVNNGSISHAYATGDVASTGTGSPVGGLVGYNHSSGTISDAYATGRVTNGNGYVGGLVGYNAGSIASAYWDSDSSGQASAIGNGSGAATAVTGSTRYNHSAYADLGTWTLVSGTSDVYAATDANGVQWIMVEGQTRPFLASEYSTTIRNAHQLQLMAYDLSARYTLAADIDASETDGSNASGMWSTAGFDPIGDASNAFTGSLDGQGHAVSELSVNRASESYVGLIGHAGSGSSIRDIGLTDVEVNGGDYVGALTGSNSGSIGNAWSSGSVSSGGSNIGGLAGSNQASGSIDEASSEAEISGANVTGGLVGQNYGSIANTHASGNVTGTSDNIGGLVGWSGGSIDNAYATGSVTGYRYIGGLVGGNTSGSIDNAYATGSVSGSGNVGGLVGGNTSGNIGNAYAIGDVAGTYDYLGGLVGYNSGTINNAYATGSVTSSGTGTGIFDIYSNYLGGLAGYSSGTINNAYATGNVTGAGTYGYLGGLVGYGGGSISNAYATGSVTGTGTYNILGGLAGLHYGTISNAFYATTDAFGNAINTGLSSNDYGTAKTYAELQQSSTFAAWDLATSGGSSGVWRIYDGYTTPLLRSLLKSVTVTVGDVDGKTYDGTSVSVSGSSYSLSDASAVLLGSASYASVTARDAGTYALGLTGLYSDQQGYDIIIVDGGYTIDKAALTVTANDAGKTYDGLAWSGGNGVSYSGFVNGEDASVLGGGLSYGGSAQGAVDVGSYGIAAGGLTADNYVITYVGGTLVVDPKAITVTANGSSSTYGDSDLANPGLSATGLVNGETVDVLSGLANSFALDHTSGAGTYVLTVDGTLTNGNYVVTQTSDGTWVVGKAALTVTINDAGKTYDGLAWSGG